MAKFATTVWAIDPKTNKKTQYSGPVIEAKTWSAAETYCRKNGFGYCKVTAIIRESPILSEGDAEELAEAMQ